MKKLFLFICLIGYFGCSENNITNVSDQDSILEKLNVNDKINLCCQLNDPFSGICQLGGDIQYSLEKKEDQELPDHLIYVRLKLVINAHLCDRRGIVHLAWEIRDKSDDTYLISGLTGSDYTIIYNITNRSDVALMLTYHITEDKLTIVNSQLCNIPSVQPSNTSEQ